MDDYFRACSSGDVPGLRTILSAEPDAVTARDEEGATGLHRAVAHADAVRLLLDAGADPNQRDAGDNALPLHFAAGGGHIESARTLLDAGSDVHGAGDSHNLEVIGWATVFAMPHPEIVQLLIQRGARHHVFSAIALGDLALLRHVLLTDPDAVRRRLSEHEQEQTALHYVIAPADGLLGGTFRTGRHYPLLETLLEFGADPEATDARGRTPLAVAMLRGDTDGMRILHRAGARLPASAPYVAPQTAGVDSPNRAPSIPAAVSASIGQVVPMLAVPDIAQSLEWYEAIGFTVTATHGDEGALDFAAVAFGRAEIMFAPAGAAQRGVTRDLQLWIRTDQLDELYARLRERQLTHAAAVLAGSPPSGPAMPFAADLYTAFYGQREFCLRDPNGVHVNFYEPLR